jgi:hypothetical protein
MMSANRILAGLSRIDITPLLENFEYYGLGYWFQRNIRFAGVRDSLYVRSLVLGEGQACQIIISVDAIFDSYGFVPEAVSRIAEELAVPAANVLVTCTHSHSTPLIGANNTSRGAEYGPYVADRIVASAREAFRKRSMLFASVCSGRVAGAIRNRRPLLADGKIAELHTDPDPERVADPGPVNDTLTLLKLRSPDGHLAGGFCHFGIHGVAIQCSELISSDCMGRAIQQIESEMGDGAVILHLNGPCADIDPIAMGDAQALDKMTLLLVEGLRSVSRSAEKPVAMTPQTSVEGSFTVRRRSTRTEELLQREIERLDSRGESRPLRHHSGAGYERFLLQEEIAVAQMPHEYAIEYQLLHAGDLIWAGVGGEIFTCFGLEIARAVKHSLLLPIGLTGWSRGYLPPQDAFSQGGYEVACARWCTIAPGETEKLFGHLKADLDQLS